MNQYRDFENDLNTFPYEEGKEFLQRLHDNGQHYIPIVDSAVYIPNPENASDAYPTFNRGNETNSFMLNPDGSLYIGSVWPGYTGMFIYFEILEIQILVNLCVKNANTFEQYSLTGLEQPSTELVLSSGGPVSLQHGIKKSNSTVSGST